MIEQEELKQQKDANDEVYEAEDREWPEIEHKAFNTQKIQYVVCLNTMGQDRKFTEDEKKFALE